MKTALKNRPRCSSIFIWTLLATLASTLSAYSEFPKWKFLVYGDSRGQSGHPDGELVNTNILSELANATVNEHPDFAKVGVRSQHSTLACTRFRPDPGPCVTILAT